MTKSRTISALSTESSPAINVYAQKPAGHFLTYIIPCYNCAGTVVETIESIYHQNLDIPFEVICTDDCSTDSTRQILSYGQRNLPDFHLYYHDQNRGGAAARNTCVANSKGDLIFCLDSDNILAPDSVGKLIKHLDDNGCDGASFAELRCFEGVKGSYKHSRSWFFETPDGICDLNHVLSTAKTPASSGNYLYTRKSYDRAGGYPDGCGAMDSWGFGFRQHATGARIAVLPDSFYWHRVSADGYWTREEKKGSNDKNAASIVREFPELFTDETNNFLATAEAEKDFFRHLENGRFKLVSGQSVKGQSQGAVVSIREHQGMLPVQNDVSEQWKFYEENLVCPQGRDSLTIADKTITTSSGRTYHFENDILCFLPSSVLKEHQDAELESCKAYIQGIRNNSNPHYSPEKPFVHPKVCWGWSEKWLNSNTVCANTKIVCIGGAFADDLPHVHSDYKFNIDHLANEYCKLLPEMLKANTHHIACTSEKMPFRDSYADYVYTRNSLDHVCNPVQTLKEIYRILKPDGKLLIGVYFNSSFIEVCESSVIDDEFIDRCIKPMFGIEHRIISDVPQQEIFGSEKTGFIYLVCRKLIRSELSFTQEQIQSIGDILTNFHSALYYEIHGKSDIARDKYSRLLRIQPVLTTDIWRNIYSLIRLFGMADPGKFNALKQVIENLLGHDPFWGKILNRTVRRYAIAISNNQINDDLESCVKILDTPGIIEGWRILWYLAIAAHKIGKHSIAGQLAAAVIKHAPDFVDASLFLKKLSGSTVVNQRLTSSDSGTSVDPQSSVKEDLIWQLERKGLFHANQPLRLHLGCGEKHLEGYVNIDYPQSEHTVMKPAADFFADIVDLAFPPGTVDEIRLHHVFEHFDRAVAMGLLCKWHQWLKKGGTICIETPDVEASSKLLLGQDLSYRQIQNVLRHMFGSHEAFWAIHKDGWYEARFRHVLVALGFKDIDCRRSFWQMIHNITVTAKKVESIDSKVLCATAKKLLRDYMVNESASEEKVWTVWCEKIDEIQGLPCFEKSKNAGSQQMYEDSKKVTVLVFSRDRAMQLQATIESFFLHCQDSDTANIIVLFKASGVTHQRQYDELKKKFSAVAFVEETDFRKQVLSLVENCKCVLFLVDDNIFVKPFSLKDVTAALDAEKRAIGFSLRLGKNTGYCYMLSTAQKLPVFESAGNGILKYNWPGAECDFGYPLELSSSVYRSNEILNLLNQLKFSNPNTLEGGMSQNSKMFVSTVPVLLVFENSVAFCNPVNIVQRVYKNNKFGKTHRYSSEQLADIFSRGMSIDVQKYVGFTPDSAHQEVELYFKSANQTTLEPQATETWKPKFSIVMANYNNGKFIGQAIESVQKQTFKDWELIIVDDCSTDNSIDIIRQYLTDNRIRLIRHDTNRGVGAVHKTGAAAVNSEFFGDLDSDDCLTERAVEIMYQHHMLYPSCGLIYSQFMFCDENLRPKRTGYCREIPPGKTNLDVDTVSHFKTFKLQDYLKTTGYDETLRCAEDKDISYKMEEVTRLKFVNECLYLYRELPNSQSHGGDRVAIGKELMKRAQVAAIERRGRTSSPVACSQKAQEEFQRYYEILRQYGDMAATRRQIRAAYTAARKQGISIASSMTTVIQSKKDRPFLSVVLTAYNRPDMLRQVLDGFAIQTAQRNEFEVIVVDDGSQPPVKELVESFSPKLDIQYIYQANKGLAAARNTGIKAVRGEIILFHDDDDLPDANLVAEHIKSHRQHPDENIAVLGYLAWHPELKITPLMHYITGPGGQYFGYTKMHDGQSYDAWKWWGGLISAKTSLLKSMEGPFDPIFRFGCEDAELACRLLPRNISIVYNANAKKYVLRQMDFEEFSRRRVKQGRALYHLAQKHPAIIRPRYRLDTAMQEYISDYMPNLPKWRKAMLEYEPLLNATPKPFIDGTDPVTRHLHTIWAKCFRGYFVQGYIEELLAAKSGKTVMTAPVCLEPLKISENAIQSQPVAQAAPQIMSGVLPAKNHNVNAPKVAIITACYNAETFLAETLGSIFAQTMPDWELWLLDDASTDATAKIIAEYASRDSRIKAVYFSDNQGPYMRRNYAIEKTLAPFIVIQDADDLMTPDKLDVLYNTISADDNCGVVGHWYRSFLDEFTGVENTEMRQFPLEQEEIKKTLLSHRTALVHGAAIIRKKLFDSIGYYDSYLFGSDSIFLEKAAQYWNHTGTMSMKNISNCLMYRRMRLASQTGLLPTFDLRSRRRIYRTYSAGILDAFREQLNAFSGTHEQLHQLFRKVSCDGFLKDCSDRITESEAQPFPWETAIRACRKVKVFLENKMFVSMLIQLHQIEGLAPDAPKRIRNFELHKAIAFWSLGDKERARVCVENELKYHTDGAAARFKFEFIERNSSVDILKWLQQIAPLHDTELRDVTALPTNRPIVASNCLPKIAVVTACYNCQSFLAETIDSILSQTMRDFELWLLDDASTDSTRKIIAEYAGRDARIKAVYFDDNTGPYVRRNYAIERTAAPFIVIHDADDIMLPGKLQVLYNHISADDTLGVVGHQYYSFIDEFKDLKYTEISEFPLEQDKIKQRLLEYRYTLVHGAAIIRKQLFDIIGLYDNNRTGSDSFWLEKAGLYWHHTGTMALKNIPDCLMLRRMHTASQTGSLPPFDPRSRRRLFHLYSVQVLDMLAAKLWSGRISDISALFRQTSCGNFLEKYSDKIKESESQMLPEGMLLGFACEAVNFFNRRRFVSCINRLNGVENISSDAPKRFKNFCLLKAMAFCALGIKEKCVQYLEAEIQNHDNPAARHFAADYHNNNAQINVYDWCVVNGPIYDLKITEVKAAAVSDMPDVNISQSMPHANAAPSIKPKVSIVIACHNSQEFLPQCLDSIMNQTMTEWELLLLDDGSTDGTRDIIENYSGRDARIKPSYFKDKLGPYIRRNYAIEHASSDFIVIQDSDDIMYPAKLQRLYEEITKDKRLGVVGSFYRLFLDEFKGPEYTEGVELPLVHEQIMEKYKTHLYICSHATAIIRKSMFDTIGLYDENPYGSDKLWLAKAAEYVQYTGEVIFANIPEYLTLIRAHASSQQGVLPTVDPRSRRAMFQAYWVEKLSKIREKFQKVPGLDVKAELKNCKCNDYIQRFGHLFEKWESRSLEKQILYGLVSKGIIEFKEGKHVTCLITLDGVERILSTVAKRFKNYDLLRGMANFILNRKEKSIEYLSKEIKNHNNPAARQFISDFFDNNSMMDVHRWCTENDMRYDLQIIDIENKDNGQQNQNMPVDKSLPAENVPPRYFPAKQPLVSIWMAAYNASDYIERAIESVLLQNYRNFELIVVDDGSTDTTADIVRRYKNEPIKYFFKEHSGLASTRNVQIKKTAGSYIVTLDSDDMMTPDFLARHLQTFEQHPEADLVYCDDFLIDENDKPIRIINRPQYSNQNKLISDMFCCGFPIVPFRTCIRKSVFDKIGIYDETLIVAEDYDMMRRFVKEGLVIQHLPAAIYLRRINTRSHSRNFNPAKAKSQFEAIRRWTETFAPEQLFLDVSWDNLSAGQKTMLAKCREAVVYLGIGEQYINSKAPDYAEAAFNMACEQLDDCCKIEPANQQVRNLREKCQSIRDKRISSAGKNIYQQV